MDIATQLKGMSPGTLTLIDREMNENPEFAKHLQLILRAKDPQKAVFEDMLRSVRTYINGQELPGWWWWELIDEIERFVDNSNHVPKPGEEGALLSHALSVIALEAATAEKARQDLPWKVYSSKQPGLSGEVGMGKYFLGIKTRSQARKQKRHERQRRLATMTPEQRAAWLANYEQRKKHRKESNIARKASQWMKQGGIGLVGKVIGVVGGIVALFPGIGTAIGAAMIIAGTAMSVWQNQLLVAAAAKARKRELEKVQEDFDKGEIDETTYNMQMKGIVEDEANRLAAEGKLPPASPEEEAQLSKEQGLSIPDRPMMTTADVPQAVKIIETETPVESVKVPEASALVSAETQYVVNQAGKLAAPIAADAGLSTARKQAQVNKTTAGVAAAALALPLLIR